MNRAIRIIAVLLIGLTGGCGGDYNSSPVSPISDVIGYVNIDVSQFDDRAPRVASDRVNYLVVYDETATPSNHDIIGTLVSPDGIDLAVVAIDTSAADDRVPQIAFDGRNYLVVYQHLPVGGANHNIVGAFVNPDTGLAAPPFAIDNSSNDNLAPAVAFNGTDYLVVYERTASPGNHNIFGVLVDPTGAVGTPFPIDNSLGNDNLDPQAASDGANYLVVYQQISAGAANHDIVGTLVNSIGSVAGVPFVIDGSLNDDLAPEVASNGGNYLVVYQRLPISATDHDIQGALVVTSGPAPSVSLFGIDISVNFDDVAPSVASDGANYLVAYQDINLAIVGPNANHDILGARVSSAGFVLSSGIAIDTSVFDDLVPQVAFGGTSYLVAYEDVFSSADHNIIGALVTQ